MYNLGEAQALTRRLIIFLMRMMKDRIEDLRVHFISDYNPTVLLLASSSFHFKWIVFLLYFFLSKWVKLYKVNKNVQFIQTLVSQVMSKDALCYANQVRGQSASLFFSSLWQPRLPRWLSGGESACQCRRLKRHGFDPRLPGLGNGNPLQYLPGKIPWTGAR